MATPLIVDSGCSTHSFYQVSLSSGFDASCRPFWGQLRPNPQFSWPPTLPVPINLTVTDPINPTTGPLHIQTTGGAFAWEQHPVFKKNPQSCAAQRITFFYGESYVNIFVWLRNRNFLGSLVSFRSLRTRPKKGSKHFELEWWWLHFKFR